MVVYLIHFPRPYHHAQHYLGSTTNLALRIKRHTQGRGSPLLFAALLAGIRWSVVATWPGGTDVERRMKRRHNGRVWCPICALRRRF